MSGIVGYWNLDGHPADPRVLDRMLQSVSHRGPDGRRTFVEGAVALGHLRLFSTPESLCEVQPLFSGDRNLCLIFDGRLDNRAELFSEIVSKGLRLRDDTDAELALRAYECWGFECPTKLLGDFAFAIWDRRERRLFAARDHMGIKPFFYHRSANLFVFGSEIRAILAHPEVPRRLKEERIADYLVDQIDRESPEATFYSDVSRLRAGWSMVVLPETIRTRDYWQLQVPHERKISLTEAAEQFRDLLLTAVRCRLRSAFPVGAMLSGGLDSSSIVCLISKYLRSELKWPLKTVSLVDSDESRCLETPCIKEILRGGWLESFVIGSAEAPRYWNKVDAGIRSDAEPWEAKSGHFNRLCYEIAHDVGIRVLLTGIDGHLLSLPRYEYLLMLARNLQFWTLWRDLKAIEQDCEISPLSALRSYVLRPSMPDFFYALHRIRRPTYASRVPKDSFISPEFAKKTGVVERCQMRVREILRHLKDPGTLHRLNFTTDLLPAAWDGHEQLGAQLCIEPRHPLADVRLINFFLGLPLRHKVSAPKPKMVMRLAMEGIVPETRGLGFCLVSPEAGFLGLRLPCKRLCNRLPRMLTRLKWSRCGLKRSAVRGGMLWRCTLSWA
jgi:asparagine synthase (glutamine-hydrolysing)